MMPIWLGFMLLCDVTEHRCTAAPNDPPTFRGIPVNTWIDRLKDKAVEVRRETAAALVKQFGRAEPTGEQAEL